MSKEKATTEKTAMKRQFEGTVVGANANKTITVAVDSVKMHPIYRKQYVSTKKYAVHDEKNEATSGDVVRFQECRPLSKNKRWRLLDVVKKATA